MNKSNKTIERQTNESPKTNAQPASKPTWMIASLRKRAVTCPMTTAPVTRPIPAGKAGEIATMPSYVLCGRRLHPGSK